MKVNTIIRGLLNKLESYSPKYMYHVTLVTNIKSIINMGLNPNTYLTTDYEELLGENTLPELTSKNKILALFKVDVSNIELLDDPEYDITPDLAQISKNAISKDRVEYLGNIALVGKTGTYGIWELIK